MLTHSKITADLWITTVNLHFWLLNRSGMLTADCVALISPGHLGSSHQLISVTIASYQWLMRPGLVGDTWAFPDFGWYGTTEPSTGPWFMVRRFFFYPVSHRISPKYINSLAAHLAMCLSTLADPLSLRGLFLYFCTLKLPKVTSHP